MSISKRTRFEVFKRDLFTCQYCGRRPPDVILEADHVHPKCEGGTDEAENLTTACMTCNRGKAGIGLGVVAPALDELDALAAIQEMAERRVGMRQKTVAAAAARDAENAAIALVHGWWGDAFGDTYGFDEVGLRNFVRNLEIEEIADSIDATVRGEARHGRFSSSRRWKYFCGICWKKIKQEWECESAP